MPSGQSAVFGGFIRRRLATNTTQHNNSTGKATTGFVLGIIGMFAWFIPILGLPITTVGLIASIKGMKSSRYGIAVAGLTLSIVGLERFQVAVAGLARVPPRSLATSATDNRYTSDGTALVLTIINASIGAYRGGTGKPPSF